MGARRERGHPAAVRVAPAMAMLGGAVVVALVLLVVGVPGLVVTAAVSAVLVVAAVANHRTLASLVAGFSLLLIRPYQPGELVRIFSQELCTVVDAEVVRIGLLTTTLASSHGLFDVANTWMLRAAPQCRD
jgi:small-conductance mechanosensitive channel